MDALLKCIHFLFYSYRINPKYLHHIYMNKKILTPIIIAIIGIGLYFWWHSDSKVIVRQTKSLVECFKKDSDSGRFGGAISTSNFRDLLDEYVYFKFENDAIPYASTFNDNINKDFLIQAHTALVNSTGIVTISEIDISLVEIKDDTAKVDLSFYIKTEKLHTDFDQHLNFKITYKKTDGDWKITLAEIK